MDADCSCGAIRGGQGYADGRRACDTFAGCPLSLCAPGAFAVALIKPQFEAGPSQVGKGGVVRDPALHRAICAMITDWWAALPGWQVLGVTESPITGPEGNKEFLIAALRA